MLHYITFANGSRPSGTRAESITPSDADHNSLRVLDALSAVLVRQHEITAVVAKHEDSDLQVFASVSLGVHANLNGSSSQICDFTTAGNPRTNGINGHVDDSLINKTRTPIIGDHEDRVPEDLIAAGEAGGGLLRVYLESIWFSELRPMFMHAVTGLKSHLKPMHGC